MCSVTSKSPTLLIHFNIDLCVTVLGEFYVSSTSSWNTSSVVLKINKYCFCLQLSRTSRHAFRELVSELRRMTIAPVPNNALSISRNMWHLRQ